MSVGVGITIEQTIWLDFHLKNSTKKTHFLLSHNIFWKTIHKRKVNIFNVNIVVFSVIK